MCQNLRLRGDGLKLTYFQLLSKSPVYIPRVGGILSPTLQDIADIGGTDVYQYYLSILLMDAEKFLSMQQNSKDFVDIPENFKVQIDIFEKFTETKESAILLQNILNFFIKEDVVFSLDDKLFEVKGNVVVKENNEMVDKYATIGIISKENYQDVVNVICQRNNIQTKDLNDPSKTKSKKALAIMEKLKRGREKMAKTTKADKNMELGNIISAVANKSPSLNMINIWDITVYQLWDCFARLNNLNVYEINAASVSAWGDKDNKFDFNGWFKKMNN